MFLRSTQYGRAGRIWIMDRGIPTEEVLAQMRACHPPIHYGQVRGGHLLEAVVNGDIAVGLVREVEPAELRVPRRRWP